MITGSLVELLLAAVAFTGGHFLLSSAPLRSPLVRRMGEQGFSAAYSVLAALLLLWLAWSYAAAPFSAVWEPPVWSRHLALALMPFALVLMVGALRKDNPTAVPAMAAGAVPPPGGVFTITRHPLMWGIGLWAALHLLANGDAASMIFFAAFLLLALPGTIAIDAKKRARDPEGWKMLAGRTSNLPFAALLAGRARPSPEGWLVPVAGGLALYAILLAVHPWLFGVSPI